MSMSGGCGGVLKCEVPLSNLRLRGHPIPSDNASDRERVVETRRPGFSTDFAHVILVWLASACLTFFVAPNHDQASNLERLYYTVYDTAVGAFIGFYLLDRLARNGLAVFAGCSSAVWIAGTLINEALIEPYAFRSGPINVEGVYYGLLGSLTMTGVFIVLRLPRHYRDVRQQATATARLPEEIASTTPSTCESTETSCFFVRVAGETRRIFAADVIYMKAEKDFTRLVCVTGEHFVSESMKSMIQRLERLGLIRVHKSFAVNLPRVDRMTRMEARVGGHRIPVGRRYWEQFAEKWKVQFPSAVQTEEPEQVTSGEMLEGSSEEDDGSRNGG